MDLILGWSWVGAKKSSFLADICDKFANRHDKPDTSCHEWLTDTLHYCYSRSKAEPMSWLEKFILILPTFLQRASINNTVKNEAITYRDVPLLDEEQCKQLIVQVAHNFVATDRENENLVASIKSIAVGFVVLSVYLLIVWVCNLASIQNETCVCEKHCENVNSMSLQQLGSSICIDDRDDKSRHIYCIPVLLQQLNECNVDGLKNYKNLTKTADYNDSNRPSTTEDVISCACYEANQTGVLEPSVSCGRICESSNVPRNAVKYNCLKNRSHVGIRRKIRFRPSSKKIWTTNVRVTNI